MGLVPWGSDGSRVGQGCTSLWFHSAVPEHENITPKSPQTEPEPPLSWWEMERQPLGDGSRAAQCSLPLFYFINLLLSAMPLSADCPSTAASHPPSAERTNNLHPLIKFTAIS